MLDYQRYVSAENRHCDTCHSCTSKRKQKGQEKEEIEEGHCGDNAVEKGKSCKKKKKQDIGKKTF
ncbi:Zinc finger CCHC domain-containing protein 4, partial [Ophiophagus hannah]